MKRKTKRDLIIAAFLILIVAVAYLSFDDYRQRTYVSHSLNGYKQLQLIAGVGNYDSTHEHADFRLYVNGKEIDFTKPEYQVKHPLVHVEDPDVAPNVIHKHATGITYGMFFTTLGVQIGDCLTVNEKSFCDLNGRTVKYYLNGQIVPDLEDVEIQDLDKVLVSYGAESLSELQTQLSSIGDNACVQSKKC